MTRAELLQKLRDLKPWLAEQGIVNVRLFGSYARDEAGPDSDVDLLVDIAKPLGFRFFGIERELAEQTRAYQQFSPRQPSNLLFDRPVNGPLSSPFGLRRFFNGEERNPHSGLDFAANRGTPIKAPAAGKVILIGDYFFNGKTVFLDHGQGLISMFCHLSEIDVQLGDEIARGGHVGKVGATGRATGPHLHWNASLNDARVDPAIFIGAFKP